MQPREYELRRTILTRTWVNSVGWIYAKTLPTVTHPAGGAGVSSRGP